MLLFCPRQIVGAIYVTPEVVVWQVNFWQVGCLQVTSVCLLDLARLFVFLQHRSRLKTLLGGGFIEFGSLLLILPVRLNSSPLALGFDHQSVDTAFDLEESLISPG